MSETVLNYILETTVFPAGLESWVVETYGKSHPGAVVRNEQLGVARVPLAHRCPKLKAEDAWHLATSFNPEIVDAILDTKEARASVVSALLSLWRFSDEDQMRLVNRKFTILEVQDILYSDEYCDAARREVARQLGRRIPSRRAAGTPYVSRKETIAYRSDRNRIEDLVHAVKYGVPLPPPEPSRSVLSRMLKLHVEELVKALPFKLNPRRPLGTIPAGALGDGVSAESKEAWTVFLHLSAGESNPTLKSLLETSKRLVSCE